MIGSTGVAWVDVLIVLVLLAYAVSGFRAGILVSASSLAGFLAGGALALWVLPRASRRAPSAAVTSPRSSEPPGKDTCPGWDRR